MPWQFTATACNGRMSAPASRLAGPRAAGCGSLPFVLRPERAQQSHTAAAGCGSRRVATRLVLDLGLSGILHDTSWKRSTLALVMHEPLPTYGHQLSLSARMQENLVSSHPGLSPHQIRTFGANTARPSRSRTSCSLGAMDATLLQAAASGLRKLS